MNLEQELFVVIGVVGILILSMALFMNTTQEEIIQTEFSDYSLYVKDTGDTCACDCVMDEGTTKVYVNRAPQFVDFGVKK